MRRRLLATGLLVLASTTAVEASTTGAWRRWPWRNGYREVLTQVGGHEYASRSARKAIDIAMNHEAVHSIGPGTVITMRNGSKTGNYVQVATADGSVVTYEHLSSFETTRGTLVAMGDLLAVSGETGYVTGPHLHLQRSATASFSSAPRSLVPIDGERDPREGMKVRSANAGIGTDHGGRRNAAIRAAYEAFGGWSTIGVPQMLTPARTPCWTSGRSPTRWMYRCSDGWVQTYEKNDAAALLLTNNGTAYRVDGSFHLALVLRHPSGIEYLEAIGFPRATRYDGNRWSTQVFEHGWMYTETGSCHVLVGVTDEPARWEPVC